MDCLFEEDADDLPEEDFEGIPIFANACF